MIYALPEPICFYTVKAHSGIAGNECADAIAKHSALHDGGHDMHFQPPAPYGNAYIHLDWLAAKDTDEKPSGRTPTRTTTNWPPIILGLPSLILEMSVCQLMYHGISILICFPNMYAQYK